MSPGTSSSKTDAASAETVTTATTSSNNANEETTTTKKTTNITTKNPVCKFETSLGEFEIELFLDKCPITCSNFIDLIDNKFYDGLSFHRVIRGFMCQFGCIHSSDPNSKKAGTGRAEPNTTFKVLYSKGKTITRDKEGNIPDEFTAEISNDPFTVSMANSGAPNSGSSQIFINTAKNNFLDWFDKSTPSKHVVFGKIVTGQEVITKIENTPTKTDRPVKPVFCIRATSGRWRNRKWAFLMRFEPEKYMVKETKISVCFQNSWPIFQNVALFL